MAVKTIALFSLLIFFSFYFVQSAQALGTTAIPTPIPMSNNTILLPAPNPNVITANISQPELKIDVNANFTEVSENRAFVNINMTEVNATNVSNPCVIQTYPASAANNTNMICAFPTQMPNQTNIKISVNVSIPQQKNTTATTNSSTGMPSVPAERCPFGYRTQDSYCDHRGLPNPFKNVNETCINNFECKSNFCSNNKCFDIERKVNFIESLLNNILNKINKLLRGV
jgi:hypothetical protein